MNKSEVRALFPHLEKGHVYLNHAAISPLSNRVKVAMENFIANRNSGSIDNFEEWMTLTEKTRELIARLIHANTADRISFMGNTSDAISAVAEGLDWKDGDEIILNTMEFPSNIQPFRILERKGVRLIYLQPDENGMITAEIINDAINPKTKMVSISAVQYLNGFRADLESIGKVCSEKNVYFIVDGIQALGAVPIDVQKYNIDALASGGHKWLMSPMGIGFLYLSEKMAQNLTPAKTGWLSVEVPWELSNFEQSWQPTSRHLETGTFNMIGLTGLHASLSLLLEIGIETISKEILKLTNYLYSNVSQKDRVEIMTPKSDDSRAGIFTFSLMNDEKPENILKKLNKNQITISSREGYLRIAPHYYNTEKEIDYVLEHIFIE